MKLKTLLNKAKKEIKTEEEAQALEVMKLSLKNIASAKKTLKRVEKVHKELLETDIEDLELDDMEY